LTAVATPLAMERVVQVTGSLVAPDRSTLSVKVAGRLRDLPVDLGSVVRQGEIIAQVEPRDYELRLQQATAALAQSRAALGLPLEGTNDVVDIAETSLVRQARALLEEAARTRDRVLSLARDRIASHAEWDAAEASFNVASNRFDAALDEARVRQAMLAQRRAELLLAQQQLADTTLRAPFNGAVEARVASIGDYLTSGAPVITLVRTDPLRLRLEVPEREAFGLRTGLPVRFQVEGDTNDHTARLVRLSPALHMQSRMLLVEADVPGSQLRPGAFVRAQIIVSAEEAGLAVPIRALVVFAGIEKVITVQADQAKEITVITGRRGPDWVEVVSGLSAGDRVVLDPGNLRTGEAVTLAQPAVSVPSSEAIPVSARP
jgi:RND family efflux transporter MFP subunit